MKTIIQKVAEKHYRTWRSAQGTKIDARFVKRDGSKITLKDKKGKDIVLTAIQLAPGSRNIVRKYEEARKAKRPDPEARYIIFLLRTKGFNAWNRTVQVCNSLGVVMDSFRLTGRERLTCPFFLDHEKKEKRFRRKSGLPAGYNHHGGRNPHYSPNCGSIGCGLGSETNSGGEKAGGFQRIDGIGDEAI